MGCECFQVSFTGKFSMLITTENNSTDKRLVFTVNALIMESVSAGNKHLKYATVTLFHNYNCHIYKLHVKA